MKTPALLILCAAAATVIGLTGCGNSAPAVSTPAEHDAVKGRQATPAEMAAAMAKASQSHQQAQPGGGAAPAAAGQPAAKP